MKKSAVLLLSIPMCLARKGVVAAISQFLVAHHGSVLHSDDHLDRSRDLFLSRLEWEMDEFDLSIEARKFLRYGKIDECLIVVLATCVHYSCNANK